MLERIELGIKNLVKSPRFVNSLLSASILMTPAPVAIGPAPIPDKAPSTLSGKVICLDPGHDSNYVPGASAWENGQVIFNEHELTFEVSNRLKPMLEQVGAQVCVTRNEEGNLQLEPEDINGNGSVRNTEDVVERSQNRVDWMNQFNPDAILSIHFNGLNNASVRGSEAYYSDTGPYEENNRQFADTILHSLLTSMREAGFETPDRGIRSDKYKTEYLDYAHYYGFDRSCDDCKRLITLGNNPMSPRGGNWRTGALIETLFLSNPDDVSFLKRDDALEIIAQGLFNGIAKYSTSQNLERLTAYSQKIELDNPEPYVEIGSGNEERPEVALTFDCGPWVNPLLIERILDVLDEYQLKTTFFVTGEFIIKHPAIFTRIVAAGHEIANHSSTHPHFTQISTQDQTKELLDTERLINGYGVSSLPLWRSPFGERTKQTLRNAAYNGFWLHIMWSLDSGDWQNISADEVEGMVVYFTTNGAIVVHHCNGWQTAERLDRIISRLKEERGLSITTVSALLR